MSALTASPAGLTIYPEDLRLEDIIEVARHRRPVSLSTDPDFRAKIRCGRKVLEDKLKAGEVIYGVNTGFGGNVKFVIPDNELEHHQRNLIEYHCCGVGEPFAEEVVRATILLRGKWSSSVSWIC
jgi:histidine ammonia-lyase